MSRLKSLSSPIFLTNGLQKDDWFYLGETKFTLSKSWKLQSGEEYYQFIVDRGLPVDVVMAFTNKELADLQLRGVDFHRPKPPKPPLLLCINLCWDGDKIQHAFYTGQVEAYRETGRSVIKSVCGMAYAVSFGAPTFGEVKPRRRCKSCLKVIFNHPILSFKNDLHFIHEGDPNEYKTISQWIYENTSDQDTRERMVKDIRNQLLSGKSMKEVINGLSNRN